MNFVQLRAFNAIIENGTVSAAAQALGVSKPAITMQIRSLEDALGIRLFHRKGHALEISDAGRQFLGPAQTMARILGELDHLAQTTASNTGGQLRIGACAPFIVVPIIAAFRKTYPGIRTEMEMHNSENLEQRVKTHDLDIGIATLLEPQSEFYCLKLAEQRVRVIVSTRHPWANRTHVSVRDLKDMPCIKREKGSMTQAIIDQAASKQGIELTSQIEIASRESIKEAVFQNLGVGFVLDHEVGRDSGLVDLELTGADLSAGEYLFCHNDLVELGSIKAFVEVAKEVYAKQVGTKKGLGNEASGDNS